MPTPPGHRDPRLGGLRGGDCSVGPRQAGRFRGRDALSGREVVGEHGKAARANGHISRGVCTGVTGDASARSAAADSPCAASHDHSGSRSRSSEYGQTGVDARQSFPRIARVTSDLRGRKVEPRVQHFNPEREGVCVLEGLGRPGRVATTCREHRGGLLNDEQRDPTNVEARLRSMIAMASCQSPRIVATNPKRSQVPRIPVATHAEDLRPVWRPSRSIASPASSSPASARAHA